MPDISMCEGSNCPIKETCYRFKAKPCEYQTYFLTPPIDEGKCDHYWEDKSDSINTKQLEI